MPETQTILPVVEEAQLELNNDDNQGTIDIAIESSETEAPLIIKDEAELLSELTERRKNGKFPVTNLSYRKLKGISNFMNSKAKFKGTVEAYYMLVAKIEFENLLLGYSSIKGDAWDNEETYEMSGNLIEILNLFMQKHEGTGFTAGSDFAVLGLPINNALGLVKNVESKIKELEDKLKSKN